MTDLALAAADYAAARAALDTAKRALIAALRESVACGMTESEAARRAGVTRMTIRAWLRESGA